MTQTLLHQNLSQHGKGVKMDRNIDGKPQSQTVAQIHDAPRFSIVTPVYNAEKYLDELFTSIENQTFSDYEIIATDDCSTDSSLSILKRWQNKFGEKMKVLCTPYNTGGCYRPRAAAAFAARGAFIVPIDADDLVAPDFLEILNRRVNETGADLVYAVFMRLDDGQPISSARKFLPLDDIDMDVVCPGKERVKDTLGYWHIGTAGCYDRSLYLRGLKITDEIVGDNSFSVETLTRILLCEAKISALCEAVYYYRMAPDSVTHSFTPRRFAHLPNDLVLEQVIIDRFGEESVEAELMASQIFLHIVDAIRKLNTPGAIKDSDRNEIKTIISRVYSEIKWKRLKKHIPFHSRLVMRMGLNPAIFIYRFFDKLRKK